jgi:hypothetical protein
MAMLQVLPAKLGSRSLLARSGEGEVTGRRRISTDGPVATVLASDPALPFGTRSPVVLPALLEKLQPQPMQPMQPAPTQLRRRALSNANIPLNGGHGEHTDCAANGGSAKPELAWDALPTQRLRAKEMATLDQQIRLSAELSAPISTRSVAPAIRHALAASGNASMGAAGAALSVPEPVSLSARPYSSSARGAARPSSCAGVPPATAPPSTAPPSTAPTSTAPTSTAPTATVTAKQTNGGGGSGSSTASGSSGTSTSTSSAAAATVAAAMATAPATAPLSGRGAGLFKAAAQRAAAVAKAVEAISGGAEQRKDRDAAERQKQEAKAKALEMAEKARKKSPSALIVNLLESRNAAAIVREVAYAMGWREACTPAEQSSANVFWYERAISVGEVKMLNEHQRVNMIPGMHDIAKKIPLAKALNRMRLLFANEFDFYPQTWTLPTQLPEFKAHVEELAHRNPGGKPRTFICKPSGGSQGRNIYLTRSADGLHAHSNAVIQEYVDEPLLLDGLKFDLRLYVLVLSVQPLTGYLFRQGMARFATNKYKRPTDKNLRDVFMHLTNYSLNKRNTGAYVKAKGPRRDDDESDGEEGDDTSDDDDGFAARVPAACAAAAAPAKPPVGMGGGLGLQPALPALGLSPSRGCTTALTTALMPSRSYEADAPMTARLYDEALKPPDTASPTQRAECWQAIVKTTPLTGRHGKERMDGEGSGEESEEESDEDEQPDDDEESGGSGAEDGGEVSNASKRSVSETFEELQRQGIASAAQIAQLWKDIELVCAKTLVACGPVVAATYSSCFPQDDPAAPQYNCFHIVGFDLLIDANFKPWLLEVNHNPSLTCDTPFDRELKGSVVRGALELVEFASGGLQFDRAAYKEQFAHAMQMKDIKRANGLGSALERERLQQQRLQERRAAAKVAASGASRTAAALAPAAAPATAPATAAPATAAPPGAPPRSTAVPAAAPAAKAIEWKPPAAHGDWKRLPLPDFGAQGGGGRGYASFDLFSSSSLHRAWRQCVGVRGRKVSAVRFQRLIRDSGLLDARFSSHDVDLLFMQILMKHVGGAALDAASSGLDFHEFCDALIEIARRKSALPPDATAGSSEALAKALQAVILALHPKDSAKGSRRISRDLHELSMAE